MFVQHIEGGASFDPPPFTMDFGAGITAGPSYKIFGKDVSAAAVDGTLTVRTGAGGFIGASGNVSAIGIPVANAALHIYFNGTLDFNASAGFGFPSFTNDSSQPFYIGASLSGWLAKSQFNFSGNGQLKLFDKQVAGAGLVLSDRGLGACAGVTVFWVDISLGFGYRYGDALPTPYFAGCDLGPYQDWNRPTSRLAQGSSHSHGRLTHKQKVLRIVGEDDVPGFTLSSDDGDTTIEAPADDVDGHEVDDHMVIPNDAADEAIVLLDDPAGEWTIEEHPGSEIKKVQRASVLPEERVDAEIRGQGRHRTLVWDALDLPRQKLQFHERLAKGVIEPIHFTGKASGRYHFTPKKGGFYGNRKLEVQVLQQGTPRAEKVVDNYRVTKPPVPRRPGDLTVRRHGHDVSARWSGSPGARSYVVTAESADGELRFSKVLGQGRRRASFNDIPLADHMVVKVFALNGDDDHGRPAKRRFDVS